MLNEFGGGMKVVVYSLGRLSTLGFSFILFLLEINSSSWQIVCNFCSTVT